MHGRVTSPIVYLDDVVLFSHLYQEDGSPVVKVYSVIFKTTNLRESLNLSHTL